jgi:leucyl aminopeptidase
MKDAEDEAFEQLALKQGQWEHTSGWRKKQIQETGMKRDEVDIMWQQAMRESIKNNEMYTRYHFAKLVAEKTLADHAMREVQRLGQEIEQETALQALHDENERLGLYKDAYAEPESECNPQDLCAGCRCKYAHVQPEQEPLIGCVNHDCAKCKEKNT